MLIKDYDMEVFTPPCDPGTESWSAIAHFKPDISDVLPYLNASLQGTVYNQAAQALTWKSGGHTRVFHAGKIAVSNLEDRAEAEQVVNKLVELVNTTWEKRAGIEPCFKQKQRPTPMAVFKLLPGTNCKGCGQPTCFTFALKLIAGQQTPKDCPPLFESAHADQLVQLQAIL